MDQQYHLLACITAHGFGHVAQTAPVLNALHARIPDLRITLRSRVPMEHLRACVHVPFEFVHDSCDIGMVMSSALDVDVNASVEAYHSIHRDWSGRVVQEAEDLREMAPDFILSNAGYLPLAGAHHAGIPCAGMGSRNWYDIFMRYCGAISGAHHISAQMLAAYNAADVFFRLTPGMPMNEIYRHQTIAPVADVGRLRRDEINHALNIPVGEKLVLVSLGGIAGHFSMGHWPHLPGVHWLVPANWHSARSDAHVLESLDMPFADILASADALICKPGYGSFVEAACSGVPVLFSSRDDWPETRGLKQWLAQYGLCREVSRAELESGKFTGILSELLSLAKPAPVLPKGNAQAAEWLERRIKAAQKVASS